MSHLNRKSLTAALLTVCLLAVLPACGESPSTQPAAEVNAQATPPAAVAEPAAAPANDAKLATAEQKVSYGFGLQMGSNLKEMPFDLDVEAVLAGIRDIIADKQPRISQEDLQMAMAEVQQKVMTKATAQGESNRVAGEKFLAENGKKEGIKTTASGLQYQVIEEGKGATPTAEDTITAHYKGTLLDGSTFDSSYDRGEPATFPVSGVIKGWTEALQLMKVGSKYRLFIPANLAYGERPAGRKIGPNSTLIFDIHLLAIEPKSAAPQASEHEGHAH